MHSIQYTPGIEGIGLCLVWLENGLLYLNAKYEA